MGPGPVYRSFRYPGTLMVRFKFLPIMLACVCYAQTPQVQPTRTDSVTVSAGLTKEEVRLGNEFDAKWASARETARSDPKAAVKQLQELLSTVDSHAILAHYRPQITVALANA